MKKLAAATLLIALGVSAMASAQADTLDDVEARGVLRVGTEMQFAPFDYLENGKQTGFNKAVFEEVGKALGVEVGFVDLPWASVLPGLEADKYDMVAGPLIVTSERMQRYRFTDPVAESSVALMIRANDDDISAPEDIAGKTVGAGKASAQLATLQAYAESLDPPVDIREYVDNNQAYADLAARRLDAVANSLPNIAYLAKQRPSLFKVVTPSFGPKSYFAYIGRGDDDSQRLIDTFNDVLAKMRDDGRLAELQEQWIGQKMDVPDHPVAAQ